MIGSSFTRNRTKELGKRAVENADDVDQEVIAETGQHASAGRPKGAKTVKREEKPVESQTKMLEKLDTVQRGLQRERVVLEPLVDVQKRAASQDCDYMLLQGLTSGTAQYNRILEKTLGERKENGPGN